MKKSATFLIFMCFIISFSQDYKTLIDDGSYTVHYISEVAENHFDSIGRGNGTGYKQFKRWEYNAIRLQDKNGLLKSQEENYEELIRFNSKQNKSNTNKINNNMAWKELGPDYYYQTGIWSPGLGRLTSIAIDDANADHIIVGSIGCGVWKTTDGGANWSVLTDNQMNLNVYSLAIDPTDSNTYFWGSNNGIMYKSTDGGATWNNITKPDWGGNVNRILIQPTNTNIMYASVNWHGIFRTNDGGNSWNRIHPNINTGYDIEFRPGDYNTIYASGRELYISRDGGVTFNLYDASSLSDGVKMIGVSAADPDVVYVLEEKNAIYGGLYKSTDRGALFTKFDHGSDNYFGFSSTASDNRGQAPRDMDIAINPADANEVHIAGLVTWYSTDGGASFNVTSQPFLTANDLNVGYCHVDVDIMIYHDDRLFVGTDGGIYVANEPTNVSRAYFTNLSNGLGIRQFYKIGISQTNPVILSGGSQDNGSSIYRTDGTWIDWLGTDGMETFIDKTNPQIIYGTTQRGALYKSLDGGNTRIVLPRPDDKSGAWVTPFEQDPIDQDVIYSGYDMVYKSIDGGSTWNSISQNFGDNLNHLKVAPSNNLVLYASEGSNFYKTLDGGSTDWVLQETFNESVNFIAVHPTNPNKIALATAGSSNIYVSTDGGSTWDSLTYNLPSFTALALVWDITYGEDILYLGMNYGIYYLKYSEGDTLWQPYNTNMPNVRINEFEINTAENKIYVATYGRGVWVNELYKPDVINPPSFTLDKLKMYPNPTESIVNIEPIDVDGNVSLRVFDNLGKIIYYKKNSNVSEALKVDMSSYAKGIYFVKIDTEVGQITKKLIVK